MRHVACILGMLLFVPAPLSAAPHDILLPAVVPQNKNLSAVDYFRGGRQSGCGLRATAETPDDIWLNVLITVFLKDGGSTFGVVKIVARKVAMEDGKPQLRDGRLSYLDIGNIQRAWIKPDSWELPVVYEGGGPSHTDAYMATVEFAGTMDLLVAISQEGFKVGINRGGGKVDEIYQFDKRIAPDDALRLSTCMQNLRSEIEANKERQSF